MANPPYVSGGVFLPANIYSISHIFRQANFCRGFLCCGIAEKVNNKKPTYLRRLEEKFALGFADTSDSAGKINHAGKKLLILLLSTK